MTDREATITVEYQSGRVEKYRHVTNISREERRTEKTYGHLVMCGSEVALSFTAADVDITKWAPAKEGQS